MLFQQLLSLLSRHLFSSTAHDFLRLTDYGVSTRRGAHLTAIIPRSDLFRDYGSLGLTTGLDHHFFQAEWFLCTEVPPLPRLAAIVLLVEISRSYLRLGHPLT